MSLQPYSGAEIPPLTVRVARASNPTAPPRCGSATASTACGTTRTSPPGTCATAAQLATVCVLQYVMNLSDRAAFRDRLA
ncbi:hypothetical protein NKH18_18105 [Streptomyces sp. M10(2022)]